MSVVKEANVSVSSEIVIDNNELKKVVKNAAADLLETLPGVRTKQNLQKIHTLDVEVDHQELAEGAAAALSEAVDFLHDKAGISQKLLSVSSDEANNTIEIIAYPKAITALANQLKEQLPSVTVTGINEEAEEQPADPSIWGVVEKAQQIISGDADEITIDGQALLSVVKESVDLIKEYYDKVIDAAHDMAQNYLEELDNFVQMLENIPEIQPVIKSVSDESGLGAKILASQLPKYSKPYIEKYLKDEFGLDVDPNTSQDKTKFSVDFDKPIEEILDLAEQFLPEDIIKISNENGETKISISTRQSHSGDTPGQAAQSVLDDLRSGLTRNLLQRPANFTEAVTADDTDKGRGGR